MKFLFFLSTLCLISCASKGQKSSSAPELNRCKSLLAAEDRRGAADCFMPVADRGNAEAQFYIGELYLNGKSAGQTSDNEKDNYAAKMFRKSADQGFAPAQVAVGDLYALGISVSKDEKSAKDWYMKAAGQNNIQAMGRLGRLEPSSRFKWELKSAELGYSPSIHEVASSYYMGNGVAKDFVLARKWCARAAESGDRLAMMWMALMSRDGQGGQADPIEAQKWFYIFSKSGGPDPLSNPENFEKTLTSVQLKEGNARAVKWLEKFPQNPGGGT